jgi:hypothetical protein
MFRCAFCGKLYSTPQERMKCESECLKRKEAEEEAKKDEAKENEKAQMSLKETMNQYLEEAKRCEEEGTKYLNLYRGLLKEYCEKFPEDEKAGAENVLIALLGL